MLDRQLRRLRDEITGSFERLEDELPGLTKAVCLSERHAFVADYSSGLQIVEVRSPVEAPAVVGTVNTYYSRKVAVAGTHAYVADYTAGLTVVNIANPPWPHVQGSVDTPGALRFAVSRPRSGPAFGSPPAPPDSGT